MSETKELLHTNPRLKELGDKHRAAGHKDIEELAAKLGSHPISAKELAERAGMPDLTELEGALGVNLAPKVIEMGIAETVQVVLKNCDKIRLLGNLPDAMYPTVARSVCELIIKAAERVDEMHAALREEQGTPRTPMQ